MQNSILFSSLFNLYIKGDHIKLVKDKVQLGVEKSGKFNYIWICKHFALQKRRNRRVEWS